MTPSTLEDACPAFLQEMVAGDGAVTLLKRQVITPGIVDGQFVAATPRAAAIYGYAEATQFCGVWQSSTQPLEELRQSFALAICRHFRRPDLPREYITTLQHPNGHHEQVVKTTRELAWRGDVYWLTRIRLAAEASPLLPHLREIPIPEDLTAYPGWGDTLTIAEVEARLAHHAPPLVRKGNLFPLSDIIRKNIPLHKGDLESPFVFGQPVTQLPNGQQLLECQRCGWVWTIKAGKTLPKRCAHYVRRCYQWQRPLRE